MTWEPGPGEFSGNGAAESKYATDLNTDRGGRVCGHVSSLHRDCSAVRSLKEEPQFLVTKEKPKVLARQFVFFLFCGGVAAGMNWGSRFLFSEFVRLEIAVVLGFLVGMVSAFFLMRVLVFDGARKPIMPQAGKFVAVNLIALAQTLVITLSLARWLFPSIGVVDQTEALAHLIGVVTPVVTSYFGHKFLTFR